MKNKVSTITRNIITFGTGFKIRDNADSPEIRKEVIKETRERLLNDLKARGYCIIEDTLKFIDPKLVTEIEDSGGNLIPIDLPYWFGGWKCRAIYVGKRKAAIEPFIKIPEHLAHTVILPKVNR